MRKMAKVIDNNDPDKIGRVLVQILPEMAELADNLLPWASPIYHDTSGLSPEGGFIHAVPELNTYVYCEVSEDWTEFDYVSDLPYNPTLYPYEETFEALGTAIEELEENTYPQPKFTKTQDGSVDFHNTETGERGFTHPSGAFVHVRSNGTMKLTSLGTTLELMEDGSFSLSSENISFLFDNENKKLILTDVVNMEIAGASDFAVLFTPLKEILEKLFDHNHVAPTGPTTPAQEPSGTPLSTLKSKLEDLKSIVKTD